MPRLINPRTDEGFKILFGQEYSKGFLIDFLNATFMGDPVIVDVEYNNSEMIPVFHDGHKYIFDIFCTTDKGTKLIVEMQKCHHRNFKDRTLRYVCSDVVRQSYRGEDITKPLDPVIGVFIMDFIPEDEDNPKVRRDLSLRKKG